MGSQNKKIIFLIIALIVLLYPAQFVMAYAFKTFAFQPFQIEMSAMVPTINPEERVLVNKFIYRFRTPKRGDIVTFYPPDDLSRSRIIIKRIIALENDKIEIKNGVLYINGKKVVEKYVKFKDHSSFDSLTIPKGTVFVMGDNRPNSKDSRIYGPVRTSDILGKAFFIYWPSTARKML